MKFNFEKHIKTPEPETKKEELNDEQIEANYEQEILAETKKLGTNLASLKSEIDALGGPEKFKEYFEKPVLMENGNEIRKGEVGNIETRGSYEIQKLSQKIKEKISLKAAVALASIMNFMHIYGISMMNQNMGNKNIQEYFSQETMQTIINNFNGGREIKNATCPAKDQAHDSDPETDCF